MLGHKYRSEVWCGSTPTGPDGAGPFLFVANYVVHNTGNRPLRIDRVRLTLLEPTPGLPAPFDPAEAGSGGADGAGFRP